MGVSRRDFLAGVGGAGLAYALHIGCAKEPEIVETVGRRKPPPVWSPDDPGVDYRYWLKVEPDGSVTAYTNRCELGQGLKTVLYNVLGQGMELPEEKIHVVLGDTDLCPEDGPTTGSAATQYVVWGFWNACPWIRQDLVRRAARRLEVEPESLVYRNGAIVGRKDAALSIGIGELVGDSLETTPIEDLATVNQDKQYVDRATPNIDGVAIVTGTHEYVGDLFPEGYVYGVKLRSEYFHKTGRLLEVDTSGTLGVSDLVAVDVDKHGKRVHVFGRTYTAARKGLAAIRTVWEPPDRPQELDNEKEIRGGAQLERALEERGNVDKGMKAASEVVTESYRTQYASQVPMETDSAVAIYDKEKTTIWASTQNPLLMRFRTARVWKIPEERVRVIGMPAGGAFGAKAGHTAPTAAAVMSRLAGVPVKCIHSRAEQFNAYGRYKESVIVDIASGLGADGRIEARRIDIYQDEGFGTVDVYDIPNVLTRLFRAPMPMRHGTMRGTSYVQSGYALESHTDSLAAAAGMNPLEFRKLNVKLTSFRPLLDLCGEMIGWGEDRHEPDFGRGIALCLHGGRQLGVIAADVRVDRSTGRIKVERLCGTFDIGKILNINTTRMGVKGSMLWGLGYALLEEVELDGHRSHTSSLSQYQIPRFSDAPPIDIEFLDNEVPGLPRGCGELPVIPAVGAICNAVYDAIGIRFYQLPMTPARVQRALAEA